MTIPQSWLASGNHQLEVWAEHLADPVLVARLNYDTASATGYFDWTDAARMHGMALSPLMLPLDTGVWSSRSMPSLPAEYQGLPGLLNDALPDGWGLYLMDKALARLKVRPGHISPAMRLAYLANRSWGALTFRPALEDDHDDELSLSQLGLDVEAAVEGHIDDVSDEVLRAGSSPQGARPKVMVDLSDDHRRAAVTTGAPKQGYAPWLIKFAGRDEPLDAPIVELAYMQSARAAGLDVMESVLLDIHGKPAFATRRFDRAGDARVLTHSLGGLIHFSHRAIGLDYAHIAEVMTALSVPEISYRQAFRRAVFNAAMSVRDDHAKNFAFVLDASSQWDISPAFDLTYMDGPGGHHTLTFAEGTTRDPTREDLLRLAGHYRVDPVDAGLMIDEVVDVATQASALARGLGASVATVAPMQRRLQEIARSLGK